MTGTINHAGDTGFTALFIRRPVMAFVLNTLIAVAGLAAFYGVEIRELPDVDRAVVTVSTIFEGAAAETVDRELTDTIEGAVARVSGVKSISSTSSFGSSRVTIEFNDGVDLNVAASDVRDAVGRVANLMPDTADPPRIVKADANSDAVMRLAVTSDNMSVQDMTVVVQDQIEDELAAVPGVADVQIYGDRDKIFRIDVNQSKLASLGYHRRRSQGGTRLGRLRFAGRLDHHDQPGSDRAHDGGRDNAGGVREHQHRRHDTHPRRRHGNARSRRRPDHAALGRQDRHRHRHHSPGRIQHAGYFHRRDGRHRQAAGESAQRHVDQDHQRRRGLR